MQIESKPMPSEPAPVIACQHDHLRLERGQQHAEYLTGWYVCVACGARLLPR